MNGDEIQRTALRTARTVVTGRAAPPGTPEAAALNPIVVRAVRTGGAVLLGTTLLRRSRLARLAVVGGAVAYAGRRRGRSEGWQDVPPPPGTSG